MGAVSDFADTLPVMVIAEMICIPSREWRRFGRWTDAIVTNSLAIKGGDEWAATAVESSAVPTSWCGYAQPPTYCRSRSKRLYDTVRAPLSRI